MSRQHTKPSICFCTKYTIETMRSFGQEPTLTELTQAIMNEAKYNGDWSAATTLFQDFDKLVWKRLACLGNDIKNLENMEKTRDETNNKLTLTQLWLETPAALRPLSKTEIKYVRQAYQIMVRYSPTIKDATKYYLHLLTNHLDTPIFDDECISHCLISLIFLISKSNDIGFMEKGLELVQIALNRNLHNKQLEVLADVSKEIFAHYGLQLNKIHGSLEKSFSCNQITAYDISSLIGCKKGKKNRKHDNRSLRIPEPISSDLME
ncbi:8421_t:CDS:1 [Cetraspora pellucida]|uniref:8421_t:CDS:1 n=1 Tax=Cetraspora pellucida TaxID=1433469 RepID=A0ACA9K8V2_9GLOM|nr:8421_t:CDS:1 [Cetraspora pellucida]